MHPKNLKLQSIEYHTTPLIRLQIAILSLCSGHPLRKDCDPVWKIEYEACREQEHDTFVSFAPLPWTSFIIGENFIQCLISIFDITNLDKLSNTTESIPGFETDFTPVPAIIARREHAGIKCTRSNTIEEKQKRELT